MCHLGDLGHVLNDEQIKEIGKVDILLIPVGGVYTLNSEMAVEVVNQIKPKLVLPMHYKTPVLKFDLEPVDDFLEKMGKVEKIDSQVLEVKEEDLIGEEIKTYILRYE